MVFSLAMIGTDWKYKTEVVMGPDKADVGTVFCRLVELTSELRNELSGRDPEGRALSLGIAAFMGAFMATMHEEDRRRMCDAAIGHAYIMAKEMELRRP